MSKPETKPKFEFPYRELIRLWSAAAKRSATPLSLRHKSGVALRLPPHSIISFPASNGTNAGPPWISNSPHVGGCGLSALGRAFTLIELLVVIAIIALLAA